MAKRCRNPKCKKLFEPYLNTLQPTCSPKCAIEHSKTKEGRKHKDKAIRKETRERLEKIKSNGEYTKEAQKEFNAFIRKRDERRYCISCQKPPKKKNAGHYRSTAAAPELRFNEFNCHLQCEYCNTHLSSNAIEYRINLVKKIGVRRVEWLEGPHEPKRYRKDDLLTIKKWYKRKLKRLQ